MSISRLRLLVTALCLILLAACNRDPRVVSRKYVDSGNKYFDKGKYKEASIMYRRALTKDMCFTGDPQLHVRQSQPVPALCGAHVLSEGTAVHDGGFLVFALIEVLVSAIDVLSGNYSGISIASDQQDQAKRRHQQTKTRN